MKARALPLLLVLIGAVAAACDELSAKYPAADLFAAARAEPACSDIVASTG